MVSNTSNSNLSVVLIFDGVTYNSQNILDFKLVHDVNSVPKGTIKLVDSNSTFVRNTTGNYGSVFFTNTTDGQSTEKYATYTFIVDSIVLDRVTGSNSVYNISFHLGNEYQIQKETATYTGPSSSAMEQIFNKRKATVVNKLKQPPTDTMTWRVVQDNIWESLDTIASHSFKGNDYIYWCFDDVNNTWKISSFLTEMSEAPKYIIMDSDNAVMPTDNAKLNLSNPPMTIWYSSQKNKQNDLAKHKEELFPNVSLSGFVDTKTQICNCSMDCFAEILLSIGDTSQQKIKDMTQMNKNNLVFGPLKVIRHWPLNVHQMYSLAKVYREYKRATFTSKIVTIKLANTVGPPVGSKVAYVSTAPDFRRKGITLDNYYAGSYLILSKSYDYGSEGMDAVGRTRSQTRPFFTYLTLCSDSLVDESNDITSLVNSLGVKI